MNRLQNRQSRIQNPKILDSAWTLVSNKINGLRPIPESSWILDLDSGFWQKTHVFCGVQSQFQNPSEYLPLTGGEGYASADAWRTLFAMAVRIHRPNPTPPHCSSDTETIMTENSLTKIQTHADDRCLRMLALDLGTKTGWALHGQDQSITSGTIEFKNDRWQGGGMRFLRFKQWLTEIKQMAGGLDAVFVEEVRRHAGVDAAHAYGGFLAHVTAWCEHHAIPYEAVPVGTIKRHATGKGNANKDAMIVAVRNRGFDPADDNEADALALLGWAMAHRMGGAS